MIKVVLVGDYQIKLVAQNAKDRRILNKLYCDCGGPGGKLRLIKSKEKIFDRPKIPDTIEIEFTPF